MPPFLWEFHPKNISLMGGHCSHPFWPSIKYREILTPAFFPSHRYCPLVFYCGKPHTIPAGLVETGDTLGLHPISLVIRSPTLLVHHTMIGSPRHSCPLSPKLSPLLSLLVRVTCTGQPWVGLRCHCITDLIPCLKLCISEKVVEFHPQFHQHKCWQKLFYFTKLRI